MLGNIRICCKSVYGVCVIPPVLLPPLLGTDILYGNFGILYLGIRLGGLNLAVNIADSL